MQPGDVIVQNKQRALLELLAPVVADVDSGCIVCIESFVGDANDELENAGIPFRFVVRDPFYDGCRVGVIGAGDKARTPPGNKTA